MYETISALRIERSLVKRGIENYYHNNISEHHHNLFSGLFFMTFTNFLIMNV